MQYAILLDRLFFIPHNALEVYHVVRDTDSLFLSLLSTTPSCGHSVYLAIHLLKGI